VEGKTCVNIYARTYPEPDPEEAEEAGALFMEHMGNLIAEESFRAILMDWLAYLVQFPGQKVRWAVLLQGGEGCGKTFLSDAMAAILGARHVNVVDPSAVFQNWNEWAFGYQLVTLEEIRVTGKNRHEVMNKMKPLITNKVISISERNRNQRTVENVSNYILFTNHHDALALSAGDRRFMVLKSPLQTKTQVAALGGKKYFERLYRMLETQAAGLRHFFENWKIDSEFPVNGPAPLTPYHEEMQTETMNELEAVVREFLEDPSFPLIQPDLLSASALLHRIENEGRVQHTPQRVAGVLRDLGFRRQDRVSLGGERHVLWAHLEGGLEGLDLVKILEQRLKVAAANGADRLLGN
jgi:hypothetical protein